MFNKRRIDVESCVRDYIKENQHKFNFNTDREIRNSQDELIYLVERAEVISKISEKPLEIISECCGLPVINVGGVYYCTGMGCGYETEVKKIDLEKGALEKKTTSDTTTTASLMI